MANFVKQLHKLANDMQSKREGNRRSLAKSQATQCWICEKPFSEVEDPENSVYLDHCQ